MDKVFKLINNFFEILINLILIIMFIIVGIFAYNFTQTKILNKTYCNLFGYTAFQVVTGSMSGSIEIKDIVIAKIQNDDLNVDDIIVFKQDDMVVTHRIIQIDEKKIVTKGDANTGIDSPIKKENVIGKVVKIIPNISVWENVLKTPSVYISLGVTVLLLMITFSIKDENKKEIKVSEE